MDSLTQATWVLAAFTAVLALLTAVLAVATIYFGIKSKEQTRALIDHARAAEKQAEALGYLTSATRDLKPPKQSLGG